MKPAIRKSNWIYELGEKKVVSNWQPFATAPKDGSEIIACKAGSEEVVQFVSWNAILREWLDRNAEPYQGATHWLPIPPTPMH
jgi:hypothetical protein